MTAARESVPDEGARIGQLAWESQDKLGNAPKLTGLDDPGSRRGSVSWIWTATTVWILESRPCVETQVEATSWDSLDSVGPEILVKMRARRHARW